MDYFRVQIEKWKDYLPTKDSLPTWVAGFFGLLILFLIGVYLIYFDSGFSYSKTEWGLAGDYFGGTVGTLITAIAFIYVVKTYKLQVHNSYIANFENIIFKMMDFHQKNVDRIKWRTRNNNEHGLPALTSFFHYLDERIKSNETYNRGGVGSIEIFSNLSYQDKVNRIKDIYVDIYSNQFKHINHYFRHLSTIFKYIDDNKQLTKEDKLKYGKILWSQLSHNEITLIGINGLTEYGENFKPLIERYSLLHGLMNSHVYRPLFVYYYDKNAFGEEDVTIPLPDNDLYRKEYINLRAELIRETHVN